MPRRPLARARVRAGVVLVTTVFLSLAGLSLAPAEADVSYQHAYTIGCNAQGMTDLVNAFKDIGGYWSSGELSGHRLVQNHETDHIVLAQSCTYNFPSSFDGASALPA